MRRSVVNLLIVATVVLLFAVAFFLGNRQTTEGEEGFIGTDSSATEHIEEANPDYEPWFSPIFEPSSGEVESGLFAMQAALGAGVLGFVLGAFWQRGRARRDDEADPASPDSPAATGVDAERDAR